MFNRLSTLLFISTFLTLPACERMDTIRQQIQGTNPSPSSPTSSVDTMRQFQESFEKKISEKVDSEVKKQIEEKIRLIEQKLVVPAKTSGSADQPALTAQASTTSTPAGGVADFRKGFSEVAAKATPAVVNVSTTQVVDQKSHVPEGPKMGPGFPFEELFKDFFEQAEKPKRVQSVGSGFIVKVTDKEAFVVTNNHVIADATKITVILADKMEVDAVLHASDERTDLALLRIKLENLPVEKRRLPVLEWGNSDEATVGQFILAIGNPFGLGSTVTSGIISGKGRDIVLRAKNKSTDLVDDFIQHDASINMGNSGGVLLNTDGKVIGINTAIFSPSGGSIGIGFAIPASLAKATIDQLIEFGRTKRGWLGVSISPVLPEIAESLGLGEARGGIVKAVNRDSPAEKAGFKENDIIIEFDGKKLGDKQRLSRVVGETPIGTTVPVKILRDGKELSLNVNVAEFPANLTVDDVTKQTMQTSPEKVMEILGMSLAEMPRTLVENAHPPVPDASPIKGGVLIVEVKENSSAEDCGLKKGDIINEVNLRPTIKPEEVIKSIEEIRKQDSKRPSVLLTVTRRGLPAQYVAISFKSIAEAAAENAKEKSAKTTQHSAKDTKSVADKKTKGDQKQKE